MEAIMQVVYVVCAGLDVHKKTVVACRVRSLGGNQVEREVRTFGTTTGELLQLLDWLLVFGCTHVAMESTGEYWRPVYNLLEGHLELLLVNAQHVKAVPGRKTDVKDAEWLAELLRHGLLRSSFVPPRPQRELRDLVRQRSKLVVERADVVNRLQKVLEDANIKLASVATDVTGVSARAMLQGLLAGQTDVAQLADLARGRMRQKREELERALTGRVRPHHRFLVAQHLIHMDFLDEQIERFDAEIVRHLETQMPLPPQAPQPPDTADTPPATTPQPPLPYTEAVVLLDTIPGVNQRMAEIILAEIGTDMTRFPSADHLASWAGLVPGLNQSGGKHRPGKIRPGNRTLRKGLLQAAHAAAKKAGCYLQAQYHHIAQRRGKNRAAVAVAHSILVSVYHMLSRHVPYQDLGSTYFDERKRQSVVQRLVRRLKKLGYEAVLEVSQPTPLPAA